MAAIHRLPVVLEKTGLSKSSMYQQIKAGSFPRPVPLGDRLVGWLDSEVEEWIQSRVAARDQLIGEGNHAA